MRNLLVFVLVLFCQVLHSQCEDCNIVRGDANCDGQVNMSDVVSIAGGTFSNGDSADANDDGGANVSDAVYLSQYLFQGGSAPPCPFPDPGKDCTQDSLETCCSPPVGSAPATVGTTGVSYVESQYGQTAFWDVTIESEAPGTWGLNCFKSEAQNFVSCLHNSPTATKYTEIRFPIQSGQKFTKKRLENGIQSIGLNFDITVTFEPGQICPWGYSCDGSNKMLVDATSLSVEVKVGPTSSQSPTNSILFTRSDLWTFTYSRTSTGALCHLQSNDTTTPTLSWSENLDEELVALMSTDCDEWKVFEVQVDDLVVLWTRTVGEEYDQDIAQKEKVTTKVTPAIVYGWCTCQQ